MPKSCTKKRIQSERSLEFAQRIGSLERGKVAARTLECSLDTWKKIKAGDYTPGHRLMERWRAKFGAAYERFINEEHDNARLAALEARHEALAKEIEEERKR